MHEASNWSTHASTVAALVSQGADPHRRDGAGETAAEIITRRGLNMTLDGSTTSAGAAPGSVLIATPVKSDAPSQKPVPTGCLPDGGGHAAPITLTNGNMARAAAPAPTATPNREVVSPTQESPRRGGLLSFGDSVSAAALGRQVSADAGESGGGSSQRRPGGVSPVRMAGTAAGSTSSTGAPSPLRQSGSLEGLGGTPARKHGASSTASNANPSPKSDAAAKRAALKAKLERKRQLAAQAKQSAANSVAAPPPMTPSMTTVGPPPTTPPPSSGPPQPSPGKHPFET
eukprot:COSAG02_NODE_6124_length_3784_cov_1.813297_5_plen_287_part_00